jgi:hypothetical protein
MISEGGWRGAIDHELPSALAVGRGSALVVGGWLYHEQSHLSGLRIRVHDRVTEIRSHSMPRVDVYRAMGDRRAYRSGFWCVVPLPGVEERVASWIVLEAETAAGEALVQPVAHTTLLPGLARGTEPASHRPDLVAICMATRNPPADLFARQIESIRGQTHQHWRCLINDDASDPEVFARIERVVGADARFELRRSSEQLGFYFNFAAVLDRVPAAASYVALADQDDVWVPHKLATLFEAIERDGSVLAYSDQRIVDADGGVLSPTFWQSRDNYSTGLRRMLAGNTVTGAGSLFRAGLLPSLLPFPPRLRVSYHDHWLALVALAAGRIAYVDEPLYDYVQHEGQVLGHEAAKEEAPRARARDALFRWEDHYFDRVLLQQVYATVLACRFGDDVRDRDMLERVSEPERLAGTLDIVVHALAERRRETLGHHRDSALGLLWRAWARVGQVRPTRNFRRGVHRTGALVDYGPTPVLLDAD